MLKSARHEHGEANLARHVTSQTAVPPVISPPAAIEVSADNAYLTKIFKELAAIKLTLLDKEVELAKAKGSEVRPEVDGLRRSLLSHNNALFKLQGEKGALQLLSERLLLEKEELAKQREGLAKELERRKRGAQEVADNPQQEVESAVVGMEMDEEDRIDEQEAVALDLGPWVNAAVKSFAQVCALLLRTVESKLTYCRLPIAILTAMRFQCLRMVKALKVHHHVFEYLGPQTSSLAIPTDAVKKTA